MTERKGSYFWPPYEPGQRFYYRGRKSELIHRGLEGGNGKPFWRIKHHKRNGALIEMILYETDLRNCYRE